MKNLTDYQKKMLEGYCKGDLQVIMSGRQTGKSTYYQYAQAYNEVFRQAPIKLVATSTVDGDTWYTVTCNKESSDWLRTIHKDAEHKMWFEHIDPNWKSVRQCFKY